MNNKQFDRSNSFTFFKNFRDTLDKYGAQFGTDVKLAMYDAIVDYGLYRRFPKDSLINTLLTPMMLDIDSSQERRAHGFRGGRPKAITAAQAKVIRQMQREGKSVRDIASRLQIPSSTLSDFLHNDNADEEYDDKEKYEAESDDISKDIDETNYDINYEGNDDIESNGDADGNYNGMVSGQFSDTCIGYESSGQYFSFPAISPSLPNSVVKFHFAIDFVTVAKFIIQGKPNGKKEGLWKETSPPAAYSRMYSVSRCRTCSPTFLQTLYGMADLFIIGQFEGVASTTAVSIGSQVMHMLTVMIVGLAMGTTVSIGQAVGGR